MFAANPEEYDSPFYWIKIYLIEGKLIFESV